MEIDYTKQIGKKYLTHGIDKQFINIDVIICIFAPVKI
jgi:hypothetical protein